MFKEARKQTVQFSCPPLAQLLPTCASPWAHVHCLSQHCRHHSCIENAKLFKYVFIWFDRSQNSTGRSFTSFTGELPLYTGLVLHVIARETTLANGAAIHWALLSLDPLWSGTACYGKCLPNPHAKIQAFRNFRTWQQLCDAGWDSNNLCVRNLNSTSEQSSAGRPVASVPWGQKQRFWKQVPLTMWRPFPHTSWTHSLPSKWKPVSQEDIF